MKKLIVFILCLWCAVAAAQRPPNYTPIGITGYDWTQPSRFSGGLHLPAGCGAPVTMPAKQWRIAGAVYLDSCGNNWYYWRGLSWNLWTGGGGGGGGGSVTSVGTGFGLLGGTITTTGTILADTLPSGLTTRFRSQKLMDSLAALIPVVPVSSVFGRTGAVIAAINDYTFAQIGSKPTTIAGYGITDNLVNSFNSRTGAVVPGPGDYTKADVGLSNVDNTSDATKNAAAVTLTNKTLASPVINSPTGIVKGDVGLGNVDNTSDATKNSAAVTLTNKTIDAPTFSGSYSFGGSPTFPSSLVTLTGNQTLTNKTLTSPVINSPTGIVKADVGLANVDNTSDATKNAASATLTNKTLTSPVINTPTGIVKGDVGLGNVDNTSDATKNAASVTLTNKTIAAPVFTGDPIGTILSSSHTPTLTNTTNISASSSFLAYYLRIGSQVFVWGKASLTASGAGATVLGISLPVTSNFASVENLKGTSTSNLANFNAYLEANTTSDRAELKFTSAGAGTAIFYFSYSYIII